MNEEQMRGWQRLASNDVDAELRRQIEKWGVQTHDPVYWIGILGEEFGECCKEAVEWGLHASVATSRDRLYSELIQVAAVAIAAAAALDGDKS